MTWERRGDRLCEQRAAMTTRLIGTRIFRDPARGAHHETGR